MPTQQHGNITMAINRHGVPKDATKAELKKIRATGSPGAKKLAHWKLNMHHNEEKLPKIGPGLEPPYNAVDAKRFDVKKKKDKKWAQSKQNDRPRQPNTMGEGVIGGAIGGAIGGYAGGMSGAVTGAKVGSAVGDAAAIGAAGYGAYKVGKGAVKAGKAVGKGVKKVKDKLKRKEVKEDARYKAAMGPGSMEWGTDVGDNYYRSLTPGQTPTNKKAPLKPLNIKAIKPEDVKARLRQKITEDFELGHIKHRQADHTKHQYPIDNEIDAQWKANVDGILTGAYEGGEITMQDVRELEDEVENYTFEDALEDGLYDPDELMDMDFDGDEYNDIEITEALSVQGRMKRRFAARRNRQKLRVARRIALRRGSTPDRLKRRAVRGARLMVYKRLLRGRDRAGLPPAEKARLERMITRFQPLVNRISVKLLPQMRRNEIKRLTNRGKVGATKSKKYKAAKPIKGAASYKAKRYAIKKPGKFKAKYKAKPVSRIKSGGPTLKKASRAYKAFSYSVG